MDNPKNNAYYLQKILTDLEFMTRNTEGLSQSEIAENEILLDSIMFRLIQISENSDKLTEDFKIEYNEIPWRAMKGMRNRIVHEYGGVDISVIYDTVIHDIPELLAMLSGNVLSE